MDDPNVPDVPGDPAPTPKARGSYRPRLNSGHGATPPVFSWLRQPGESEEQYERFLTFRNMPPTKRSVEEAFRITTGEDSRSTCNYLKSSSSRWRTNALNRKWGDRARDWDNHVRQIRDQMLVSFQADVERKRIRSLRDTYDSAQKIREKALKMMDVPVIETVEKIENGRTIIINKPGKWTFHHASEMLARASEMERAYFEAAGVPIDKMTDEERAAVEEANYGDEARAAAIADTQPIAAGSGEGIQASPESGNSEVQS